LEQIAARIEALIEEPDSETTELLILPFVVESFDDFLDLSALAEALIESLAWQDKVQLATFHPHYCFADTDPESIENYTNRCPWPVIQLLQVDAVSRALERVENPDEIPARNIECLQSMDEAAVDRLLRDSCAG